MPQQGLYDTDFYQWTQDQAAALRDGKVDTIDWENVAEEIESLGRSIRRAVRSQMQRLLLHLLKWQYQPVERVYSLSWYRSIMNARTEIDDDLLDSPSVRRLLGDVVTQVYLKAREEAAEETRLPLETFPTHCPWRLEQILDAQFFPGEEGEHAGA